jgi:hypothetical protein
MAKNTGQRKNKPKKASASISAEKIVEIINAALLKSITDAGLALSAGAIDEWEKGLLGAVKNNLKAGGQWTKLTAHNVTRVAADMGAIAVIISAGDAEVTKNRLHAAFRAAKFHKVCPGAGSGAWCDFNV